MVLLSSRKKEDSDHEPSEVLRARISLSEQEDGEKHLIDKTTDMLFQSPSEVKWVPYNKFHVGDYEKVYYDKISEKESLSFIQHEEGM